MRKLLNSQSHTVGAFPASRGFLAVIFLLLTSVLADRAAAQFDPESADRRPPNFVVFFVDDMGWNDSGCYGNKFHETPNIDRLARQGMRFTDAYAACPVCSPTRAALMTGRYPATLNLTDFIPGHLRPWAKLVPPKFNQALPLEEVTFAEALKDVSYVSGSFGKWHLGGREHFPDKQGFDEFVVTGGRHFAPRFRTTPKIDVPDGEYLADTLTRLGEAFIEKHKDRPFVLYLPHYAVHIPLEAEKELIANYEKKATRPQFRPKVQIDVSWPTDRIKNDQDVLDPIARALTRIRQVVGVNAGGRPGRADYEVGFVPGISREEMENLVREHIAAAKLPATVETRVRLSPVNHPVYAAMVEHVDRSLGRVLKKLDDAGVAENTVVIFTSDNGGLYRRFDGQGPAVMSTAPLRGEKGSLYEGGIRVPLIIRWPGVVQPGGECREPVCTVDLLPTMTEIAGVKRRSAAPPLDGKCLVPLLKQAGEFRRNALYWHYPHYHHTTPAGAIRAGDYKLIEYFEDGRVELYNLKRDPGETRNLAKNEPQRAENLKYMLAAWRKAVAARMPAKNPGYDPKRADEWGRRRARKK